MIDLITTQDYEKYYEYLEQAVRQDQMIINNEDLLKRYLEILKLIRKDKIFALEYISSSNYESSSLCITISPKQFQISIEDYYGELTVYEYYLDQSSSGYVADYGCWGDNLPKTIKKILFDFPTLKEVFCD